MLCTQLHRQEENETEKRMNRDDRVFLTANAVVTRKLLGPSAK